MYKAIITDLDETLLNDQKEVSSQDIETIKRLREQGIRFVLSTGRPYSSTKELLQTLGMDEKEDEFVISFNGGAIQNTEGKLFSLSGMDYDLVNALFKIGKESGIGIHVYTTENTYVTDLDPDDIAHIQGRMAITDYGEEDLERIRDEHFVKILYSKSDMDYLKAFREKIRDYEDQLEVSYSSGRYLEMNKKGVSKGSGLLAFSKLLDIPKESIIAVGDNFNDLSMIQEAGLGIGVANANADIKDQFDFILESTNNENPITEIAGKFIEEQEA